MLSVTDWIALGTIASAAAIGLLSTWLAQRRPRDGEAEETYRPRPKPIVVALHDEDRDLARGLKRGLSDLAEELSEHRRAVAGHGDRVADQTDALKNRD